MKAQQNCAAALEGATARGRAENNPRLDLTPRRNNGQTRTPQQPGFLVIEQKEGGREVTIGPYDEATAQSVAKLFAWAGAVTRIERAS